MQTNEMKKNAAEAAIKYIPDDAVIGVGTGSTVHYFIEALAAIKHRIAGAVASSNDTAIKLKKIGIEVVDLNNIDFIPVYVDGADEIDSLLQIIKGGGGALTREKIIAAVARKRLVRFFLAAADAAKIKLSTASCVVAASGRLSTSFQNLFTNSLPNMSRNLNKKDANKSVEPRSIGLSGAFRTFKVFSQVRLGSAR